MAKNVQSTVLALQLERRSSLHHW